jgi:predicted nucleic-acid-binding protein
LIDTALASGKRLYVDTVVMCEVVWVLRAAYGFDKATVSRALSTLIDAAQLALADRDLLRDAAARYAAGSGDFADYVLALRGGAAGCETTMTFDRKHKKSELFTVL